MTSSVILARARIVQPCDNLTKFKVLLKKMYMSFFCCKISPFMIQSVKNHVSNVPWNISKFSSTEKFCSGVIAGKNSRLNFGFGWSCISELLSVKRKQLLNGRKLEKRQDIVRAAIQLCTPRFKIYHARRNH